MQSTQQVAALKTENELLIQTLKTAAASWSLDRNVFANIREVLVKVCALRSPDSLTDHCRSVSVNHRMQGRQLHPPSPSAT
jgi:hypothetical protein